MTPTTIKVQTEILIEDWNSGQYTTLTLAEKHGIDRNRLAGHIFRLRKLGHPFSVKKKEPNLRAKNENKEQIKKPPYQPSVNNAAFEEKTKVVVESLNVKLINLKPHMCRWPHTSREIVVYCGHRKMEPYKRSTGIFVRPMYCEDHQRIQTRETK